jgi:hypothetical protein
MLPPTNGPDGNYLDRNYRGVWGRQMELLLRSIEIHKAPFSSDGSPYEYRTSTSHGAATTRITMPCCLRRIHT